MLGAVAIRRHGGGARRASARALVAWKTAASGLKVEMTPQKVASVCAQATQLSSMRHAPTACSTELSGVGWMSP